VPKIPILFDHTPLEEMPFKEPEIRFGNSNIERLPTKYKDVLRNIVRAIAIEGGWSTARIKYVCMARSALRHGTRGLTIT
jgi:hypothetical protein